MITTGKIAGQSEDRTATLFGKSTDIKPISTEYDIIPNGSALMEIDTGDVYFYDADTDTWLQLD